MLRYQLRRFGWRAATTLNAQRLPRTDPEHVLNVDRADLERRLDLQQKLERFTNLKTKVAIDQFLQAVFANRSDDALHILGTFLDKCKVNTTSDSHPRNVEVYSSCLALLASHLSYAPQKSSIKDIQKLATHIFDIPKVVLDRMPLTAKETVKTQLPLSLLKMVLHQKNRVAKVQLLKYTDAVVNVLESDKKKILSMLNQQDADICAAVNTVWPGSLKYESSEGSSKLPSLGAPGGAVSFKSLCTFISSHSFVAAGEKAYRVYESLPFAERAKFLEEYLTHNRVKQVQVEKHCESLFSDINEHARTFQALLKFSSEHAYLIQLWKENVVRELESVCFSAQPDTTFEKSQFLLTGLPTETLASIILSKMISANAASVLELVNALLSTILKQIALQPHFKHSKAHLFKLISRDDAIEVMGALIKIAIDSCAFQHTDERPFTITTTPIPNSKYKRAGVLMVHEHIADCFRMYDELGYFKAHYLPMLCPPKQWTSPDSGGYLGDLVPFLKSPDSPRSSFYLQQAHKTGQMDSIYQGLNKLGSVGWTINPEMLQVFSQALTKTSFMNIPSVEQFKLKPPERNEFDREEQFCEAVASFKKAKASAIKLLNERRNLRLVYEMVHQQAKAFEKNGDIMFFPHNLDFRGRTYPSVSVLSHHSEDMIRSLLMFWEAKPLGPDGFKWIQYQLANLFAKGHMTMNELLRFVAEHRTFIEKSASDPFEETWWQQGSNPWQSLAVCKEIKRIWDAGNDPTLTCRIPVHQDGTCNGLQHYAALGADPKAAFSVNLVPHEKRQDVYVRVLELVRSRLETLPSGESKTPEVVSKALELLSRKLIKQTVMTTVYGVTLFGATRQIRERIEEIEEGTNPKVASLIAEAVLASISDLFQGAQLFQGWLLENCVRCIQAYEPGPPIDFFSRKYYRPMMWTSLSGLPIIQPYFEDHFRHIATPLQQITVKRFRANAVVDIRKQRNGIAPNFIHSLDAMHLLMTCLASDFTLAAVHDSYWTHACDVERMSQVIREQFIRLHSSDIISNLRDDILHITRNAKQMVWVLNATDFAKELAELRRLYGEPQKRKKAAWNEALNREIGDNSRVADLVRKHQPKLYFSPKDGRAFPYSDNPTADEVKVSVKTHTPLLVPVCILAEPPVGTFDIGQVLHSRYFFS